MGRRQISWGDYYIIIAVGTAAATIRQIEEKMAVEKQQDQKNIQDVYPSDTELTPFTLNILKLESILFRVEMELEKEIVVIPRLNILMSEASSLREELMSQKDRAIAANGIADLNVQRFLQLLPVFQKVGAQMVESVLRGKSTTKADGAAPPKGPVDNGGQNEDDGRMDARLTKLESIAEKTQDRLASIEQDVAVIKSNYATKADISALESTLLKWFIATAVTMTGLAFTIAKFVH